MKRLSGSFFAFCILFSAPASVEAQPVSRSYDYCAASTVCASTGVPISCYVTGNSAARVACTWFVQPGYAVACTGYADTGYGLAWQSFYLPCP